MAPRNDGYAVVMQSTQSKQSRSNEAMAPLSREQVDQLADDIAVLAARIDAATHQLLTYIRQFDEAKGWARQGAKSCAHWLSWRVGIDLPAAREKVRAARALGGLAKIDAALERGELSYSKVRALTRVADERNEALLLDMAKGATGAQLCKVVRSFRKVQQPERCDDERRYVRKRHIPADGMVRVEMKLHPDEAERVWQALRETKLALGRQMDATAVASPKPNMADAAMAMAEAQLATFDDGAQRGDDAGDGPGADGSGSDGSSPDGSLRDGSGSDGSSPDGSSRDGSSRDGFGADCCSPGGFSRDGSGADGSSPDGSGADGSSPDGSSRRGRRRPVAERRQLLVHLSEDRLARGELGAELQDGTPLVGETFLRLACDAGLVVAKTDSRGDVLDVGRASRTVTAAISKGLLIRDRHCRWPGCTHSAFVEAHHVRHWAQGGETSLDNTMLLCHSHHQLAHEGGFRVERGPGGTLVFYDPQGRIIEAAPVHKAVESDAAERLTDEPIDRLTSLPSWDGSPLDLNAAVDALVVRQDRASLSP